MIFVDAIGIRTPRLGREHIDSDGFFRCEFCRCNTNAHARACCETGREADRAASKARRTPPIGGAT